MRANERTGIAVGKRKVRAGDIDLVGDHVEHILHAEALLPQTKACWVQRHVERLTSIAAVDAVIAQPPVLRVALAVAASNGDPRRRPEPTITRHTLV